MEDKNVKIVAIDKIIVPPGRRPVRDITDLAQSIDRVGQLNPLTVREDFNQPGFFLLIAGLHRLNACKFLGRTEISVRIVTLGDLECQLAEIDENVVREPLTELELAEQLAKRKEIYEKLHPETKAHIRGGVSKAKRAAAESAPPLSFAEDTARKTGKGARTVQESVQIGQNLSEEAKEIIRDTPIAKKKTVLVETARLPKEDQVEAAKELVAEAQAEPEKGQPKLRNLDEAGYKYACSELKKKGIDKLMPFKMIGEIPDLKPAADALGLSLTDPLALVTLAHVDQCRIVTRSAEIGLGQLLSVLAEKSGKDFDEVRSIVLGTWNQPAAGLAKESQETPQEGAEIVHLRPTGST